MPSEAELNAIQPIDTFKYISHETETGMHKAMVALITTEPVTDEIRISYVDRYAVYDDDPALTLGVFKYLIYWIRRFGDWEETYETYRNDDEAEELVKAASSVSSKMLSRSTEYADSLLDESLFMMRSRPNAKHERRLRGLSGFFGYAYYKLLARDMDMRLRRDRFFSPLYSIRSAYGRDHLLLRFYCTQRKAYQFCVMRISSGCIVCGKEKDFLECAKCREAVYCSREHQKQDWRRHRNECFPRK